MASHSLTHKPWPTWCCLRIPGICALTLPLFWLHRDYPQCQIFDHMDWMQSPLLLSPHPKHQPSMTPNKLIITVILSTNIGSLQNKKINLTKSYVSLLIRATRQQRVHSSRGNCNIPEPLSFTAGPWISMVLFPPFWPTCVLLGNILFFQVYLAYCHQYGSQCTILDSSSEYQIDKGPWEVYRDKEQGNSRSSGAR